MLYLKEFRDGRGEMYLYFPGVNRRTPYKRSGLFVLMDDVNSAHVEQVMAELNLETLCRLLDCQPYDLIEYVKD